MKRILLLFLGVMLAAPFYAQKSSKEARQLLDRVAEKITDDRGYKVIFSVLNYAGENLIGGANGTLFLKNDQFTCETPEMKTWFDGKHQWSLIYDSEEVNLTEPSLEELVEINPYALLKLYKKGYSSNILSQKQIDGMPFAEVVLIASSKKNDLQKLTLWINTKTNEPHTIDVVRSNGDNVHINIESVKQLSGLDNSIFVFNEKEYPNFDVIDLR